VYEEPRRYRYSSWHTIYRALLGCFGRRRYHLGKDRSRAHGVLVTLTSSSASTNQAADPRVPPQPSSCRLDSARCARAVWLRFTQATDAMALRGSPERHGRIPSRLERRCFVEVSHLVRPAAPDPDCGRWWRVRWLVRPSVLYGPVGV
jgi:hypothetical protein